MYRYILSQAPPNQTAIRLPALVMMYSDRLVRALPVRDGILLPFVHLGIVSSFRRVGKWGPTQSQENHEQNNDARRAPNKSFDGMCIQVCMGHTEKALGVPDNRQIQQASCSDHRGHAVQKPLDVDPGRPLSALKQRKCPRP